VGELNNLRPAKDVAGAEWSHAEDDIFEESGRLAQKVLHDLPTEEDDKWAMSAEKLLAKSL